jgi:hypothetical protein
MSVSSERKHTLLSTYREGQGLRLQPEPDRRDPAPSWRRGGSGFAFHGVLRLRRGRATRAASTATPQGHDQRRCETGPGLLASCVRALRVGHIDDPRYAALTWQTADRNVRNSWLLVCFAVCLTIQVILVVVRLACGDELGRPWSTPTTGRKVNSPAGRSGTGCGQPDCSPP